MLLTDVAPEMLSLPLLSSLFLFYCEHRLAAFGQAGGQRRTGGKASLSVSSAPSHWHWCPSDRALCHHCRRCAAVPTVRPSVRGRCFAAAFNGRQIDWSSHRRHRSRWSGVGARLYSILSCTLLALFLSLSGTSWHFCTVAGSLCFGSTTEKG